MVERKEREMRDPASTYSSLFFLGPLSYPQNVSIVKSPPIGFFHFSVCQLGFSTLSILVPRCLASTNFIALDPFLNDYFSLDMR